MVLGIIESKFLNSSIQCDIFIFQLICLSPSYDHFFAANKGNLPLTIVVNSTATQGLYFIGKIERVKAVLYLMVSKTCGIIRRARKRILSLY